MTAMLTRTDEATKDDQIHEEKLGRGAGVSIAELARFAELWPDVEAGQLNLCVLRAEVACGIDALDLPIRDSIDADQDLLPVRRGSDLLPYEFR